jgi:hypothetical protein
VTLRVDLLSQADAAEYESFVLSDGRHLLQYSLKYQTFLSRVLASSEPRYLLARQGESIVAALPAFIKCSRRFGTVVNSLPFYGSHGGVVFSPRARNRDTIGRALMEEYFGLAKQFSAVSVTVIDSPFHSNEQYLPANVGEPLGDERIGQITDLPPGARGKQLDEMLLSSLPQKTRNAVRKGLKSGLKVTADADRASFEILAGMHQANIEAVGGLSKPVAVFHAILDTFANGQDYRLYIARKDGAPVAALLVFFYNQTIEYFTPATEARYRAMQPMSLLIFKAMCEGLSRGMRYWNWGGTWRTQEGVYKFKRHWGARDYPYRYHVRILDTDILRGSRADLLDEYRFFYVAPFARLTESLPGNPVPRHARRVSPNNSS